MSSSTHTEKMSAAAAASLRETLGAAGWLPATVPAYAAWSLAGPGARVVYYRSGKLVLQGKHAAQVAAEFLGATSHDGFAVTLSVPQVGSDETGKGDFLGPLVVAAVLVRPGQEEILATLGVRDSKAMTDRGAAEAAHLVREGFPTAVVRIDPERYNVLHGEMGSNLNRLLAWAHAKALGEVLAMPEADDCGGLIVDRFAKGPTLRNALRGRAAELPLEERPRAEDHPAVAAASVVARQVFLAALKQLGDSIGLPLAKGAGPPADAAARRILAKGGPELLARVAKMHFRNAEKVGAR